MSAANYYHPMFPDYTAELNNFTRYFSQFLKKGDWAVDIGAATGDSTIVMGSLCGESGKVIAFEPSEIFSLLKYNVDNNLSVCNFEIHNIGLSDKNEISDFFITNIRDNGGVINEIFTPEMRGTKGANSKITLKNALEYFNEIFKEEDFSKIKLIKIDTEGMDFIILKTLAPIITKYRMPLFVERWESKEDELFKIIEEIGFNSYTNDMEPIKNKYPKSQDIICISK